MTRVAQRDAQAALEARLQALEKSVPLADAPGDSRVLADRVDALERQVAALQQGQGGGEHEPASRAAPPPPADPSALQDLMHQVKQLQQQQQQQRAALAAAVPSAAAVRGDAG